MIFPNGGDVARHPSQLYEAFLEGFVLFVIVWIYSRKPRPTMATTGLAVAGYGVFRFFIEFYRLPDAQLGYLALDWVTMGQILSLPMIIVGVGLMAFAYKREMKI
jgi:phosphatidylglycerol:prolipoprotein diacylglycerol transferase